LPENTETKRTAARSAEGEEDSSLFLPDETDIDHYNDLPSLSDSTWNNPNNNPDNDPYIKKKKNIPKISKLPLDQIKKKTKSKILKIKIIFPPKPNLVWTRRRWF